MTTTASRFKYIACDYEKCIGCQLCEYICSYTKTGEYNTYRSRIRIVRAEEILITAVACRTCEDAPCVVACPRDALIQDPRQGSSRWMRTNAMPAPGASKPVILAPSPSTRKPSWLRFATNARMWMVDPSACCGAQGCAWNL